MSRQRRQIGIVHIVQDHQQRPVGSRRPYNVDDRAVQRGPGVARVQRRHGWQVS